ncbi:murein L,D-transpeptidase family protein [Methylobacterium sp.]|uniref:L,D-transpeptidase family protein n=1 Tax=Methylobacterium sp. TaxID=409 RepID=UPI0025E6AD7A|nr:murein L,D-transpeptidase family protein [Methylobacterium sp.]
MIRGIALATGLAFVLAACQGDESYRSTRHLTAIPPATMALMSAKGVSASDPILMRAYKKESEIEVWKRGLDGQYALLKTYPMCRWSGQLGPKVREGDRQAPEGFYDVTPAAMNPNSSLFLSFNLGYPNAYDRSHGRTGSHLMVHGTCSSRGCFAMTDEAISEVYAIAREAFAGGQRSFQFQSYPFRMTAENLAKHRADQHIAFWKNLKEGSDQFEVSKREPTWSVVGGRYAFPADPSTAVAVAAKQARDERAQADLVAKGTPAIRLVYEDGGGHQSFREIVTANSGTSAFASLDDRTRRSLGDVSRPEALARGPEEVVVKEARSVASVVAPKPKLGTAAPGSAPDAGPAQHSTTTVARSPETKGPTKLASAKLRDAPVVTNEQPVRQPTRTEPKSLYDRARGLFGS